MSAVSHKSRGLHTAACHGSKLAEGHSQRRHACILAVCNDYTVGERLNAADTLKTSTGGHGIFHNGVQRNLGKGSLSCLLYHAVYIRVHTLHFILAAFLGNRLAGTCRRQLLGCLGIQPGHSSAKAESLRRYHAAVRRSKGLAQRTGIEYIHALIR